MDSGKRENGATTQEQQPNSKSESVSSHECDSSNSFRRVVLNPADCDLTFNIEADGLTGNALYKKVFAYFWSGARGNVGITRGKYCFGCTIISEQPVTMDDTPVGKQHLCRVGISKGDVPVGKLGATEHSFSYGGIWKFQVGDTIVCLVDLESKPASLEFLRNGKHLCVTKHFDAGTEGLGVIDSPAGKLPWESAIFPHVLLKNTVVKMQFSIEDGLVPEEGYKPWDSAVKDGNTVAGPSFSDPKDCEIIMMVGLPASGKTTWAKKKVKENPEKRYIMLGSNLILDQMKVSSLDQKPHFQRFAHKMDREMFKLLLSRASKVSRNYIIDETNVYKSARMNKLEPFHDFRKIAVVIFPSQEQLEQRFEKQNKETRRKLHAKHFNEMLDNFVLPGTDEYFDEVIFTDLSRDEAQQVLDEKQRDLNLRSSGAGPSYSGYSCTSLGIQTGTVGSLIGQPPTPLQPHAKVGQQGALQSVHRALLEVGQQGALQLVQQYHPSDINTRFEVQLPWSDSYQGSQNPFLATDGYHGAYSGYGVPVPVSNHDQFGRYVYETPGYGSNLDAAGSFYHPPYAIPPYGTPYPSYPSGVWLFSSTSYPEGTAPFGTQNPSYSAGAGPSAPYETPNPSSTAGF